MRRGVISTIVLDHKYAPQLYQSVQEKMVNFNYDYN